MELYDNSKIKKILSGKVREVYEVGADALVIVTSDRISAFDVILRSLIPGKGEALNKISDFWFDYSGDIIANHIISTDLKDMPAMFGSDPYYEGRTVMVSKLKMLPYEIIVRGYMFGGLWEAYSHGEDFCGQKLEGKYELAQRLTTPIITPSAKRSSGHDENISLAQMEAEIGSEMCSLICNKSLELYEKCYKYAAERGIIIADTKFEFGIKNDELCLADEIFTPDCSRFWDASAYRLGESPKSYDKQFVRDWLTANKLNGVTPAPELPAEIIEKTSALYGECLSKITAK